MESIHSISDQQSIGGKSKGLRVTQGKHQLTQQKGLTEESPKGGQKAVIIQEHQNDRMSTRKYNYKIQLPVMPTFNILPESFRPGMLKDRKNDARDAHNGEELVSPIVETMRQNLSIN